MFTYPWPCVIPTPVLRAEDGWVLLPSPTEPFSYHRTLVCPSSRLIPRHSTLHILCRNFCVSPDLHMLSPFWLQYPFYHCFCFLPSSLQKEQIHTCMHTHMFIHTNAYITHCNTLFMFLVQLLPSNNLPKMRSTYLIFLVTFERAI